MKIKNNFFKDKSKFCFIMIFMLIKINLFMIFLLFYNFRDFIKNMEIFYF
jgi:hypothetical protein